jgi:hypothetical protein
VTWQALWSWWEAWHGCQSCWTTTLRSGSTWPLRFSNRWESLQQCLIQLKHVSEGSAALFSHCVNNLHQLRAAYRCTNHMLAPTLPRSEFTVTVWRIHTARWTLDRSCKSRTGKIMILCHDVACP